MASNKAFVEASAGSVGALFACLALFPLDVAKTKHQASVKSTEETSDDKTKTRKEDTLSICKTIWDTEGVAGLFAGLGPKAIHTVLSNFCYFYWYAWLKSFYEKKVGSLSTAANLAIGALAGAINMSMTLPWEVISTYIQTSGNPNQSQWDVLQALYKQDGVFALWKGYIPSLVLVSNPAINYTIFDRLKLQLVSASTSLSALQAFVLAAIAKSIATVMTYPIIRAKVIMQAKSTDEDDKKSSMTDILQRIWATDGLHGFFKGCEAQLFNTVLKSALLLMTKEQITFLTLKLLGGATKSTATR